MHRAQAQIFISYRRNDSQETVGRICDHLKNHFEVFVDVYSMLKGINFHDQLTRAVESCDVLLAVIGEKWLEAGIKRG